MRKNKIRIVSILLIMTLIGVNSYAHSGRTDSNGGHRDNRNKSGLGGYHYHCGGYPAHLHTNGICPYSSSSSSKRRKNSSSSNSKKSTSSSSSSLKTTKTVPKSISVTSIQINENIEDIEVGKSKILTATITPSNATNKNITWKSSNESIATINSIGEVVAKSSGTVNITAISSNGKTSTIKINVKQALKNENNMTKITNKNSTINNNTTTSNQEEENILGGIVALGLLGGGGYWLYKKDKKE